MLFQRKNDTLTGIVFLQVDGMLAVSTDNILEEEREGSPQLKSKHAQCFPEEIKPFNGVEMRKAANGTINMM